MYKYIKRKKCDYFKVGHAASLVFGEVAWFASLENSISVPFSLSYRWKM